MDRRLRLDESLRLTLEREYTKDDSDSSTIDFSI